MSVETRQNGEVLPQKSKPCHLVLLTHTEETKHHLLPWGQKIEAMLKGDRSGVGKVAVFIERAHTPHTYAQFVEEGIAKGLSLKDAQAYAYSESPENNLVSQTDIQERDNTRIARNDGFYHEEENILTTLLQEYPGRIQLVHEWSSEIVGQASARANALEEKSVSLSSSTPIMQRREAERKWILAYGAYQRVREEHIAAIIDEATSNRDIIGTVAWMGVLHTGLGHELKRKGHKVTMEFPAKSGETFYHPLLGTLFRQARFQVKKPITLEDVHITAWANRHFPIDPNDNDETRQAYLKKKHDWVRKEKQRLAFIRGALNDTAMSVARYAEGLSRFTGPTSTPLGNYIPERDDPTLDLMLVDEEKVIFKDSTASLK